MLSSVVCLGVPHSLGDHVMCGQVGRALFWWKEQLFIMTLEPGVVGHTRNPQIWEVDARGCQFQA